MCISIFKFLYLTSLSTQLSIELVYFFCVLSLLEFWLRILSYFIKHLSANKNNFVPNYTCILSSSSLINDWTDCIHYFRSLPILPFGTGYDYLHVFYILFKSFSLILKKSWTYFFFIYNSILSLYLLMHSRTFSLFWRSYGNLYSVYYLDSIMFDYFYAY